MIYVCSRFQRCGGGEGRRCRKSSSDRISPGDELPPTSPGLHCRPDLTLLICSSVRVNFILIVIRDRKSEMTEGSAGDSLNCAEWLQQQIEDCGTEQQEGPFKGGFPVFSSLQQCRWLCSEVSRQISLC